MQNAGGVEKGIRRKFNAVVDDNTLDIRFYWAGRGASTFCNVHGPLISAISVNPSESLRILFQVNIFIAFDRRASMA